MGVWGRLFVLHWLQGIIVSVIIWFLLHVLPFIDVYRLDWLEIRLYGLDRHLHHGLRVVKGARSESHRGIDHFCDVGGVVYFLNVTTIGVQIGHLELERITDCTSLLRFAVQLLRLDFVLLNLKSAQRAGSIFLEEPNQLTVAVLVDDMPRVTTQARNHLTIFEAERANAADHSLLRKRKRVLKGTSNLFGGTTNG